MNLKNKLWKKAIFFVIISIFFYSALLLLSDFDQLIDVINKISIHYYLLIFPVMGLVLVFQGIRYHMILKILAIKLTFKESFLIYLAGLSMLLSPGGSGLIVRSFILKQKTGKSISSTTPITIFERWLELVSIIILIGIFLFWQNFLESIIVFVIGVILSGLIFFIFRYSIGLNFLNKLLTKIRIFQKFTIDSEEFRETTRLLTGIKNITKLLFITFITKFFLILVVFFIFELFSFNLDVFSSSQVFFTSQVMGILSFVPGGIVVIESGLLGLITKTGIDFSNATMLVLLIRFLTFWFPMLVGFVSFKIVSKKN